MDCGYAIDHFMVTNQVWASAGLDPRVDCCLACLQRRLRSALTIADFTVCSVNRQAFAATGRLTEVLEAEQRKFDEYDALMGASWDPTLSVFSMDVAARRDLAITRPYYPPNDHSPIERRQRRLAVAQDLDELARPVAKKHPDLPLWQAEFFLRGKTKKRFQSLMRELKHQPGSDDQSIN
jgi:hypothetical protein